MGLGWGGRERERKRGTEYLWVLAAEIKGWDGGGRLGTVRIFRVPREWR